MANPHKGAVALETADKVYSLRFTTNSICELEDALGRPVGEIVSDLQSAEKSSMKLIRSLVWGGLIADQPDLTTKEAGEILDSVGMAEMTAKIGTAFQRFFPSRKGGANENPPKAKVINQ